MIRVGVGKGFAQPIQSSKEWVMNNKNLLNLGLLKIRNFFKSDLEESRESKLLTDTPITTANEDLLRRTAFAKRIALLLSSSRSHEGQVFAIRGSWGAGKTSFKNLVVEHLNGIETAPNWLDFNPWQWSDSSQIIRALFQEIANKLGSPYSAPASNRAKNLRKYGDILTGSGRIIQKNGQNVESVSQWVAIAASFGAIASLGLDIPQAKSLTMFATFIAAIAFLSGKLLSWFGRDRWDKPIHEIRDDLEESLRSIDKPLVIFIDDIDRLEADEIRSLIRNVKANANLPNITFVLLYQPQVVESALENIAGVSGRDFLEKIVQISFDLPAISPEQVQRIFTAELSSIADSYATEKNGFENIRWGNCLINCILPHIKNLRDARRLLASFSIHIPVHEGPRAFEANIIDALTIETLRVFDPKLHQAIYDNRNLFLQEKRFRGDGQDQRDKDKLEEVISLSRIDKEIVIDTFKELFPPLRSIIDNHGFGEGFYAIWIKEKRVCTTRFFDRYFELQNKEGSITESDFVEFLDASARKTDLEDYCQKIESRGLLSSLAERMDESVSQLPVTAAANIIPQMFMIGEKLIGNRVEDPFNSPWISAWRATSWYFNRIDKADRKQLFTESLKEADALAVPAILISLDYDSREKGSEREYLFEDENLIEMTVAWVDKIELIAQNPDALLAKPNLIQLLYRWRSFSGSLEAPKKWLDQAVKKDSTLVSIILSFLSRGTSQGWGDRVAKVTKSFNRDTISLFFDINSLSRRIEKIELSNLSPDESDAIKILRGHIEKWEKGESTE
ncbi:MAG: putative KAP-like P-loop ATPase [Parasphingorhabdus sp.]